MKRTLPRFRSSIDEEEPLEGRKRCCTTEEICERTCSYTFKNFPQDSHEVSVSAYYTPAMANVTTDPERFIRSTHKCATFDQPLKKAFVIS